MVRAMCFQKAGVGVNSRHRVLRPEQPERINSFATWTCHQRIFEDAGSRQNTTIAWMPDVCGVGSIGMTRPSVPPRRQRGLPRAALAIWTAPPHSSATLSLGYLAAQKQTELMLQGQAHGFIAAAGSDQRLRGRCIGHVIILEPAFLELHGPWLLAHELSHTRRTIGWAQPTCLSTQSCRPLVSCAISFARLPSSHQVASSNHNFRTCTP